MVINKIRDLAIAISVLFASFSYGYPLLAELDKNNQYKQDRKECLMENNNWQKQDRGYDYCMLYKGY